MTTNQEPASQLGQLRIERGATTRRARGGRSPWWARWLVVLAILAVLGFILRERVLEFFSTVGLPDVKVVRVVQRNAAAVAAATGTSANGYIVAKTRAALSADTPGRIVAMNVQEGSIVKKGDVVARLYSDEYAAALRRAEGDLEAEKAGTGRFEAQVVASQKELDTLHSRVTSSEAEVSQYSAALTLAQLSLDRAEQLLAQKVENADRRDRARKDHDEAQALLKVSEAQLATAKLSVAEGEARLSVAHAAVEESKRRVDAMTASRDLARATLDKTEVRAPFDGIVVLKDAEVGEVVSPNSQGGTSARGSVVTMVDFATLEVEAEVPETSLAAVVIGAEANMYLDAYPEKPYRGRVDRIWPTANRTKATVEVRITFLERDERLRPEMGVRVVFGAGAVEEKRPAEARILVPAETLVKNAGKSAVFVLERDVVRYRDVQIGEERAGKVAILSGLTAGEEIVLAPADRLKDGVRVHVDRSTP